MVKTANPNAIVIGPDISFMQTNYLNGLIAGANDITSTSTVTGKPYCDIFAWHTYPYDGAQIRSDVIGQPSHSASYGFTYDLNNVRNRILNFAAVPNKIKLAITEMNVNWQNGSPNTYSNQSCNSFLAGQWMAEMYATALNSSTTGVGPVAFMMPWSLHESNGDASQYDLSILNGTNTASPGYRSTYVHTKLMAEGFNAGTFRMGTVSTNTNVKVFSTNDCAHLAIMIMNQESATAHTVTINHGSTLPTTSEINAKLNISPTPSWSDIAIPIGARESILLIYDACHNIRKQYTYNEFVNSTYALPAPTTYTNPRSCRCSKTITPNLPNYSLRCAVASETGTVHYNTTTLTANTRIKDSAFVTGNLTVPLGITLTIDTAEVTFSDGAKIIVQAGGALKITGSNMHGCPGSIWSGIQVGSNNATAQFSMTSSSIDGAGLGVGIISGNLFSITNNVFTNCNTGIKMKLAHGFTINGNEFSNVSVCIKTGSALPISSTISENLFFQPDTAILSKDDVNSLLDISCNGFVDYTTYGIYATGGTLKQQGTSDYGAGNFFSSTSNLLNHQLYYTGLAGVNYYCDPSNTFTLSSTIPGSSTPRALTATVTVAANDGICDQIAGKLANHGVDPGKSHGTTSGIISDQNIKDVSSASQLLDCRPNPT